jgi:hypothetical protein
MKPHFSISQVNGLPVGQAAIRAKFAAFNLHKNGKKAADPAGPPRGSNTTNKCQLIFTFPYVYNITQ